jgi:hypothetical protein
MTFDDRILDQFDLSAHSFSVRQDTLTLVKF